MYIPSAFARIVGVRPPGPPERGGVQTAVFGLACRRESSIGSIGGSSLERVESVSDPKEKANRMSPPDTPPTAAAAAERHGCPRSWRHCGGTRPDGKPKLKGHQNRWQAQVDQLGDCLLRAYGPFLVRGKQARGVRLPLLSYDLLMSCVRESFQMETLLKTGATAYEYVQYVSRRELEAAAAAPAPKRRAVKSALAVADRYGLDRPLLLRPGPGRDARSAHGWARDHELMREFLAEQQSACTSDSGVRRRPLSHAARMAVWNRWTEGGMYAGSGPCHACGRLISQQEFECGHVVAVAHGGSDGLDNLRPLCRACNRSMGTKTLDEFKDELARGRNDLRFTRGIGESPTG